MVGPKGPASVSPLFGVCDNTQIYREAKTFASITIAITKLNRIHHFLTAFGMCASARTLNVSSGIPTLVVLRQITFRHQDSASNLLLVPSVASKRTSEDLTNSIFWYG